MAIAAVTVARSGHELPIYPSYYPHEIAISATVPQRAAELLVAGEIQAYVGAPPQFAQTPPPSIASIASLGSFVMVRINPRSPRIAEGLSACAISDAVVRDLAEKRSDLILHPYPVTPLHSDYLYHVDRAEAAKARILESGVEGSFAGDANLRVTADSEFLQSLLRPAWRTQGPAWDAELVEVRAAELLASAGHALNGWSGPPWLRTGWFAASLLLRDGVASEERGQAVDFYVELLQGGEYSNALERIDLERSLVTALARECTTRVAGYTLKREYYSTVFTAGIENIGFDALTGFNSPMFMRTVKLRDFPWNGWLALGVATVPQAAWNPIAGFTDDFGRLMWSALGDAASIPSPYEAAWILNRISDVRSSAARPVEQRPP
jgi:hypothetical protein